MTQVVPGDASDSVADIAAGAVTGAPRPAGRGFGSPYLYYLIFAFFLANTLVTMDRALMGVLIVPIRAEMQLTDTQLGTLSMAFAVFYAVFGIALGRLTDTSSRPKLLAWSMALLGLATMACGWVTGFVQLFVARTFCGVGEAGSVPSKYSLIGDSFRPQQRASALALIYAGLGIGPPLGLIVAGYLGDRIGWRDTFLAFGLPAMLAGLLIYFTIREPGRGVYETAAEARSQASTRETLRTLAVNRTFLFIVFGFTANSFGMYGLGYWIPSFFIRSHGMTLTQVGAIYGSIVGLSILAGLLIGASLSTRLLRRDRRYEMWVPGWINVMLAGTYALTFAVSSRDIALAMTGVSSFLAGLSVGPATAGLQSTVPARMRGTASAVTMFVSALIGQGMGPWLIGRFSDLLAPSRGAQSLSTALLYACALFAVGGVLYLSGARSFHRDRVD